MATVIKIHGHGYIRDHGHLRFRWVDHSSILERYYLFIEQLDDVYFGTISMAILIGSCIGGISIMFGFENNSPLWQIAVGVAFSMANNITAILQFPTKWVFNIFVLNILINVSLIVSNTFLN